MISMEELIGELKSHLRLEEHHGVVPYEEATDFLERKYGQTNDGELIEQARGRFVIDVAGRIFMDMVHIGWLRKEAGDSILQEMASVVGAEYPLWTGDFVKIEEK